MKKAIRILSVILLAVLLAALALGLYVYYATQPHEPVALLDGVRFGSAPRRVIRLLGSPAEVTEHSEWEETDYRFNTELDGVPVSLRCTYHRDRVLKGISAVAVLDSPESAERLYERWKDRMTAAYQDEEGFWRGEETHPSETACRQELGIELGAECLSCTLERDGNTVTVVCSRLW